jgi:hypothetical protein
MYVEEGEEDPRIVLLVHVRFPTLVHCKHLSGLFFLLLWRQLGPTHD